MKAFKFIILIVIIAGIGFGGYKIYEKINEDKTAWKIEITNKYINVRSKHDQYEALVGKVTKGEKFKVLDIYLEDRNYVWYKIETGDKLGWVASSRSKPYVKEVNNPNAKNTDYKIDYANPVVKYYEEKYYAKNIDSITYDHLEITDDSKWTIKSEIYIEECFDYQQYWITYEVTDEFNNKTEKIQCIVFEEEPPRSKVKDLSEIRAEVCVEER